jgi:hypothetical protein
MKSAEYKLTLDDGKRGVAFQINMTDDKNDETTLSVEHVSATPGKLKILTLDEARKLQTFLNNYLPK